ncbi:MAG: hypothetical protein R3E86_21655 [Pseudomonadales bacterium]
MTDSRRRGVRASRIRLEQALAEAGLPRPTQAALAERIADQENLDAAPKDLVSRVFREQPVDPQSIERVARGLGVPAHTLYQTSADAALNGADDGPENPRPEAASAAAETPAESPMETALPARGSRPRRIGLVLLALSLLCVLLASLVLPGTRSSWQTLTCRLSSLTADQQIAPGHLGVLIARLDGDPQNQGQRFIADRFLEDPELSPFLSVITLCDGYSATGPGDRRAQLDAVRDRAQAELHRLGAHLLLWGERAGNLINLRLVSTRTDLSPQQVELNGKPVMIDERYLELPLDVARPQNTMPDLKRLALALMQLNEDALSAQRDNAISAYRGSTEWLKASIVSDRNLRSSIRPEVDPTRWALVNAQLCYKYRLLGDIAASEDDYQSAVQACEAVLDVRPRAEFPQEWAAVKTNLGSAWLRLYAYARTLELAVERLHHAEAEIQSAAESISRERSPQLWAVNRRTLGTIYIRLGELSDGPDASTLFDRGVAELQSALEVQRPEYQPLDWALTQQNICLAQYQHGARLGAAGAALVREAMGHCEEAVRWLSPASAALSWGMVQNNLAASTAILAQLEGDANLLEQAAEAFAQAQRVYTRKRVPVNWAEVEVNLGELNCNLALMRDEPARLADAERHTQEALRVFIEHGVARYQRHAERLLAALDACDREDLSSCRCGD